MPNIYSDNVGWAENPNDGKTSVSNMTFDSTWMKRFDTYNVDNIWLVTGHCEVDGNNENWFPGRIAYYEQTQYRINVDGSNKKFNKLNQVALIWTRMTDHYARWCYWGVLTGDYTADRKGTHSLGFAI